jgi:hypothetical protein
MKYNLHLYKLVVANYSTQTSRETLITDKAEYDREVLSYLSLPYSVRVSLQKLNHLALWQTIKSVTVNHFDETF